MGSGDPGNWIAVLQSSVLGTKIPARTGISTYGRSCSLSFPICEMGDDDKAVPSPHSCEDEMTASGSGSGKCLAELDSSKDPHLSALPSKSSQDSLLCL